MSFVSAVVPSNCGDVCLGEDCINISCDPSIVLACLPAQWAGAHCLPASMITSRAVEFATVLHRVQGKEPPTLTLAMCDPGQDRRAISRSD